MWIAASSFSRSTFFLSSRRPTWKWIVWRDKFSLLIMQGDYVIPLCELIQKKIRSEMRRDAYGDLGMYTAMTSSNSRSCSRYCRWPFGSRFIVRSEFNRVWYTHQVFGTFWVEFTRTKETDQPVIVVNGHIQVFFLWKKLIEKILGIKTWSSSILALTAFRWDHRHTANWTASQQVFCESARYHWPSRWDQHFRTIFRFKTGFHFGVFEWTSRQTNNRVAALRPQWGVSRFGRRALSRLWGRDNPTDESIVGCSATAYELRRRGEALETNRSKWKMTLPPVSIDKSFTRHHDFRVWIQCKPMQLQCNWVSPKWMTTTKLSGI